MEICQGTGGGKMKKIETFYRLTEEEKQALIERCRQTLLQNPPQVPAEEESIKAELADLCENAVLNKTYYYQYIENRRFRKKLREDIEDVVDAIWADVKSDLDVRQTEILQNTQAQIRDSLDGLLEEKLQEKEEKVRCELDARAEEARKRAENARKGRGLRMFLRFLTRLLLGFCTVLLTLFLTLPIHLSLTDTDGTPVYDPRDGTEIGAYYGALNCWNQYTGEGYIQFSDGTVYTTLWIGGVRLPFTQVNYCRFPNGTYYEGKVSDTYRPDGEGTYTNTNGERVTGVWSWEESSEESNGTYTGMILDGERYGYGILISSVTEGAVFTGEFYRNICRNGTWAYANGDTKETLWWDGNTTVVYNYAITGSRFEGDFEHAEGEFAYERVPERMEGRFFYDDGSYADGGFTWTADRKDADGTYTGYLLDGKRVGYGTLTYENGESYEGEFGEDGLPNGNGVYRSADGKELEVKFENGRFEKCQVSLEVRLNGAILEEGATTYIVSSGDELIVHAVGLETEIESIEYTWSWENDAVTVSEDTAVITVPEGKAGSICPLYVQAYAENYSYYENYGIANASRIYWFKLKVD